MFRAKLHISRLPAVRIPNMSAQSDTPAAEKARREPYKCRAGLKPETSSQKHFATENSEVNKNSPRQLSFTHLAL
jgi:hypothetical protein